VSVSDSVIVDEVAAVLTLEKSYYDVIEPLPEMGLRTSE